MSGRITRYLQRKRKQRLFNQWVEKGELSSEEVPADLLDEKPAGQADLAADDIAHERLTGYTTLKDIDRGMIRVPIRYVLIMLSIIASLLVVLSVLLTILIMRT